MRRCSAYGKNSNWPTSYFAPTAYYPSNVGALTALSVDVLNPDADPSSGFFLATTYVVGSSINLTRSAAELLRWLSVPVLLEESLAGTQNHTTEACLNGFPSGSIIQNILSNTTKALS